MGSTLSYRLVLSVGTLIALLPINAMADFIVEFTDGRRVTVGQYVDEGQIIKIYTPRGAIGFRKADIKQITKVGAGQDVNTRLETVTVRPSAPFAADRSGQKQIGAESSEAGKGEEEEKEAARNTLTTAEIERFDQQYQDVNQRYKELWEAHKQQVRAGVSDEELAENRSRLLALDEERSTLRKQVQQQASPNELPAWAR